ncbi:MAG: hypothetical protein ACLQVD_15360 [Capsulimonadaceae bacterium]
MRVSGVVAMILFLLPSFYVVKYYAVDRARETAIVRRIAPDDLSPRPGTTSANVAQKWSAIRSVNQRVNADDLPLLVAIAQNETGDQVRLRLAALDALGNILRRLAINVERPLEAVQAKSAIAGLAESEPNPTVRTAAQNALGKIARGGAVIRR